MSVGVFSQSLTLLCLIVQLHFIRRHVRCEAQVHLQATTNSLSSPLLLSSSSPALSAVSSAGSVSSFGSSFRSPSSPTSLFATLIAHSHHLRNSQMLLGLHAVLYLLLGLFIVTAQPRYHHIHGVLINTLLTLVSLTFLITFSFPIRAKGAGAEDEEQMDGTLKSIREEGEAEDGEEEADEDAEDEEDEADEEEEGVESEYELYTDDIKENSDVPAR